MTKANRKMIVTIFESGVVASLVVGALAIVVGNNAAIAFCIATATISIVLLGFMHITNVIDDRRRSKR